MRRLRAVICSWCGNVDDMDGQRCPCPHDELEWYRGVEFARRRHVESIRAAHINDLARGVRRSAS